MRLCLNNSTASFVCETRAVSFSIPSAAADRSELITDLLKQAEPSDDEVSMPLPLSLQETRAWLSCAGQDDTSTPADADDAMLLLAHKVKSPLNLITF